MKTIVEMHLTKETKNCYRFEAHTEGEKPAVDCIYLQKSELKGQPVPQTVKVTVESLT